MWHRRHRQDAAGSLSAGGLLTEWAAVEYQPLVPDWHRQSFLDLLLQASRCGCAIASQQWSMLLDKKWQIHLEWRCGRTERRQLNTPRRPAPKKKTVDEGDSHSP